MDCLRFSLLPSILGNLTGKHSIVNTVSIPNRDYGVKQAFIDLFSSLLVWAVRHERLRTVAEVSIPNRGYSLPISLVNSDCTLISLRLGARNLNGLLILFSRKLCYHQLVWLQRLSAGTETGWTIFYSSDPQCFLISSQKPPSKQFNWRVIWKPINRWNFLTCNLTPQKSLL
jgi:hypothetical protein